MGIVQNSAEEHGLFSEWILGYKRPLFAEIGYTEKLLTNEPGVKKIQTPLNFSYEIFIIPA